MNRVISPGMRYLVGAAALFVIVAGLRAAAALCVPLLLGFFLAVLCHPILALLRARRVPTGAAILLIMLALGGLVAVAGMLLSAALQSVTEDLPTYRDRLVVLTTQLFDWLRAQSVPVPEGLATEVVDVGSVLDVLTRTLRGLFATVGSSLLVLLTTGFMLAESVHLRPKLDLALGRYGFDPVGFETFTRRVQNYLGIKTLISLATGLAVGFWVNACGLDFPVFWGLVAFLMNYIPTLGSILASVPAVLLAVIQLDLGRAAVVLLGYVLINLLFGSVLEPSVMGRGLRLSPLIVFLSLLFWGWVWGPVGAILSVPLTISIKIFFESHPELRWVAKLLNHRGK